MPGKDHRGRHGGWGWGCPSKAVPRQVTSPPVLIRSETPGGQVRATCKFWVEGTSRILKFLSSSAIVAAQKSNSDHCFS